MAEKPTYEELEQRIQELEEGTEHKFAENIVWEPGNWAIFDALNYGVFIHDKETGEILDVNERACEIRRQTREEMLNASVGELSYGKPPYSQNEAVAWMRRAIEEGPQFFEWLVKLKDGDLVWNEVNLIAASLSGKECVIAIARDISLRKQAEDALRKSEEKYRSLTTNIPDVTWTTDYEGKTCFISPNIEKEYGYTPEEIYTGGDSIWLERIDPEDAGKVKKAFRKLFEEGTMLDVEYRIKRKDGEWIWLHDRSIVIYERDGVMYADGIFSNVTERKRALEKLRENEKNFRAIFENIQDVYYQTDMKGKVVLVSPSAAALFEVDSPEELIGCDIAETFYYHPEDRKELLEEILKTGYLKNFLVIMKRSGGAPVPIEINAHLIYDKEGNITGIEGIARDISERKQAEETLRRYEEHYSIMVENSLNAIILYEQEKILFANKTFFNIFGYDSGELKGLTVDDILAPEVAEYVSERRRRRLAGEIESTAVYETKGKRKNGEIFDMEISVCLVAYQNKQCCMAFLSDISGRKKAEEALRASQQRFTTLFNRNPIETIVVDLEGIVTEINYAKRKSNRRMPNIGDRMYIDYAAKHKIDMSSELMKSMENKEPKAFPEMWYREKCISINISPFDEGAIITSVDCTSLKYAEQKLRESEEKHKRIVENALTGIYQVEKEGGFIMANQRIAEMFGYDSPESLMSSVDSIASLYAHPEERAMILQEIDEKGSVYGKEAMFKRKTGVHFWVKYHVRMLREKGKTIYEGLMEDVTAEKSSQEAERASELRYRSLFENAPMGISLTTPDGQMFDANDAILQMMCASRSDLKQMNLADFYKNFQDRETLLKRLKRDGSVQGFETILKRKDGTFFDARLNIARLNLDNRDLLLTIVEDFTKEKVLADHLERAQKMEAIGTLAGGVAHDLNNILGGLVSYPELLLLQLPDDSPLRKSILTIQKSGEKAAAVVQDLLTLARRGVVVTEVVNLNAVIAEYLKSPEYEKLQSYHPGVHIETHLEKNVLNILGSSIHLSKTVMNLVSNAAEAMSEGGRLTVSTENRYVDRPIRDYDHVKEGDYVVLTISDTGTGISPDDIEKIFEPFYTKKKMGRSGTGLGMAVVWGTVKDHNGYIDVQSTEGKGTTFTLYFPATREKLPEDKSHLAIESYSGNGESILIVDDVEEQKNIASGMLKELGYSVVSVSSGEEAVEYLKTNNVDLLLLDMIMDPGMDGLDTYKKILEMHPDQKAIIASGFSETDRVKEVLSLGAGTYIRKPFLLEKVGLAVKEELEK